MSIDFVCSLITSMYQSIHASQDHDLGFRWVANSVGLMRPEHFVVDCKTLMAAMWRSCRVPTCQKSKRKTQFSLQNLLANPQYRLKKTILISPCFMQGASRWVWHSTLGFAALMTFGPYLQLGNLQIPELNRWTWNVRVRRAIEMQ